MDDETKLAFKHQTATNKRYEGYFHEIWDRLDLLPKWAWMLISSLVGVIGFLSSSLMHLLSRN